MILSGAGRGFAQFHGWSGVNQLPNKDGRCDETQGAADCMKLSPLAAPAKRVVDSTAMNCMRASIRTLLLRCVGQCRSAQFFATASRSPSATKVES
jgi:hypothetical protein